MEQRLFIRKDEVEVSFVEEELKGAYYRAILEDNPTKSGHKKLKVCYLTLFNKDCSAPLTEFVDQRFIRPVPSEDLNDGVVFEEGLLVNAYLRDGWWTGVVVKTLEDDKYLVYFDSPPDIIEFERNQLRVHLDWTGFKWIRPHKKFLKELIKSGFCSGKIVELRLDFAWLPALIIKELENEKRFIIKYCNKSFSCSEESKTIVVDSLRVRPPQPPFAIEKYDLLDHVEAFTGFEWRQGVVRGIVFEGRYMVSFGATKEASQFNHSNLRPPMEWEDGVWRKRTKVYNGLFFSEKYSGSLAMTATKNKTQGKISPEPMNNGFGNESTREKMPEEHKTTYYIRKRKRGELKHNAYINETVLSSDRTPSMVKNSAVNVDKNHSKNTIMVLPFAKKSPVWETYESMEVFGRVSHSPHFSPVVEIKEDFREGYALGMMVTYSGLLEKCKDLETDVPVSQLISLKDSFAELEKHGFDVTWPCSRIDKLLALKDRQLNILEELKDFDKEMMDESSIKCKAKQELGEVERKILEVKHKIIVLQRQEMALEKHKETAKEQKDATYKKICQMESCAIDLSVELEDVELEFERTLSAPW